MADKLQADLSMSDKTLKPYKSPDRGVLNLRTGAVHSSGDVLILAGLARLDAEHTAHTIVLEWNGRPPWYGVALNWSSSSCCAMADPPEYGLVGIDGEFGLIHGTDLNEYHVGDDSLSAVVAVGRSNYAVGAVGRVFFSANGESWKPVAHADRVSRDLLEAAAAYSPDEVYAVGAEGAIVLLEPNRAERIDSPTNLVLSGICRGPNDLLYSCGQKGVILSGRKHEWKVIEHGVTEEDLWDVCTFQDRVFVTSTHFLFELKGDRLETVSFEHETPHTFCKLAVAGDEVLLSVGQGDAFLFDGHDWNRLI